MIASRAAAVLVVLLASCTSTPVAEPSPSLPSRPSSSRAPAPASPVARVTIPSSEADHMLAWIAQLAVAPREATSRAYRRAAAVVEDVLGDVGYTVRRDLLEVPAGRSWGIDVPAGRTFNVVAEPVGFRATQPHLIVGAHLDTVPQAPGANDNASGIAVMLDLALLAARDPAPLPIVFVAFAAEEPRQPAGGYFGSTAYVDAMGPRARAAMRGMLALDRVGIGEEVKVCTTRAGSAAFAARFMAAARLHDEPARRCANRTSDHASFAAAGMPGVRLLGAEHPTYHTAADTLDVVDREQILRMTTVAWQALRGIAA